MKHLFFGSVALLALAAVGPAIAADMPIKAPVYKTAPLPPAYNWTGFYVGINAGGAWGDIDVTSPISNDGPPPAHSQTLLDAVNAISNASFRPKTGMIGVQAGYDVQYNNLVLGAVADFSWLRLRASRDQAGSIFLASFTLHDEVETDWLFTARPRLGVIVGGGGLLIYGTGGVAVTHLNYAHSYVLDSIGGQSRENASISRTKLGWSAGGGFDYALPSRWTFRGEYLFADFGDVATDRARVFSGADPLNTVFDHSGHFTLHTFRASINYKFDWGKGPLVARY